MFHALPRKSLFVVLVATLCSGLLFVPPAPQGSIAAEVTLENGTQFRDVNGNLIQAHGSGMMKVGNVYYWYGENRNPDYTFKAVSMYRSTDLKNWEFVNDILTSQSDPDLNVSNIERPKIIYNRTTDKYVLWAHKENGIDYGDAEVAVASSDTVDGDYTYHGSFRPLGYDSRDMTVFNDNGTAYLISATSVNADLNIYRLTPDFLDVESLVQTLWPGAYREAPAMFKRNGVYFLVTSGATGWDPNQAKYATATNIEGTWSGLSNFGNSTTYDSQSTFVMPIEGSQTTSYLYMGDRWAGAWGGEVNESRYVWLPLEFPDSTSLEMNWYANIHIDTDTGVVEGSAQTWDSGAYYKIITRHSGKLLGPENGNSSNGTPIEQWSDGGWTYQHWQLEDAGNGYFKLKNRDSGKVIGVENGSTEDGAPIDLWDDGSWTSQHWRLVDVGSGYYKLQNRATGKLIDISSVSREDGTNAIQWSDNGGKNQHFQFIRVTE